MMQKSKLLLTFMGVLFTAACSDKNVYQAPPPPEVTVSKPDVKTVTEYFESTGRTVAIASVEIPARVSGFLQRIHFKDGEVVKKGALLFEIDPSEYEAEVRRSKAAVEVTKTGLELAEATYARMKEAGRTGAVSEIEVIESKAKRDQAKALVEAREADLARAELDLGYTKITAPIRGQTSKHLVDIGNLVGSGTDTLLTTIVKIDPIHVNFNMSERELLILMNKNRAKNTDQSDSTPKERLARIRKIPVEVGLSNEKGFPHIGNLDYVDPEVDPSTGTLLLRGLLSNTVPPYPPKLIPGLFVRVRVPLNERKGALLIAEQALSFDQAGSYLLVIDEQNTVHRKPVKVGIKIDNKIVVKEGLEPEDQVIIEGILRARPGAKVTPRKMTAASTPNPKDEKGLQEQMSK